MKNILFIFLAWWSVNSLAEKLDFPFKRDSDWEICQGYNTPKITHKGDLLYSLDLSIGTGHTSGNTKRGCSNFASRTNKKLILAPASGTLLISRFGKDLSCLQLDEPVSTGFGLIYVNSLTIGHIESDNVRISNNKSVTKGQTIGLACSVGSKTCPTFGQYAHIHITGHKDNKCETKGVPLGRTFAGFNFTSDNSMYQWRKTKIEKLEFDTITPILSMLLLEKEKRKYPFNDTGITWGGDHARGNNLTCTSNIIGPQDCHQGRDNTHNNNSDGHAGFSFTKLDNSGNSLPATTTIWSCVKDDVTGLVWEVKTDNGSIHDKDNTYRWGGKTTLGTGYGTYYADWDTIVDGSNNENLCGYTNWRIPTFIEMIGLANMGRSNPAIDINYFPETQIGRFWSSSPAVDIDQPNNAWLVYFAVGVAHIDNRDKEYYVRLVRNN